jgi:hypothetical protein
MAICRIHAAAVSAQGQGLSKGQMSKFFVQSINVIPLERLSSNLVQMFTLTWQYVEPMLLLFQLNGKVTLYGQMSNSLYLLYKSHIHFRIFFKIVLKLNVYSNRLMCRTHANLVPAPG